MVRNSEKLEMATQFRKRGFSYTEIAKICGVSKSTISGWLSKKAFSRKVRQHNSLKAARENVYRLALINKAKASERHKRYQDATNSAKTGYKHYRGSPLFIAGLSMFITKGNNASSGRIQLTSADPDHHRIFHKFLIEFLGLSRSDIKFWLLYSSQPESAKRIWQQKLKLTKEQWYKDQISTRNTKSGQRQAIGTTLTSNAVAKRTLEQWSVSYRNDFSK